MVVPARDEAELEVTVVDGHSIGVEWIVFLTDEVQFGSNLELLEGLAAFPVAESGDVKVGQMDLLHRLSVFASHKASVFVIKQLFLVSESKVKARLLQNVGQPRNM